MTRPRRPRPAGPPSPRDRATATSRAGPSRAAWSGTDAGEHRLGGHDPRRQVLELVERRLGQLAADVHLERLRQHGSSSSRPLHGGGWRRRLASPERGRATSGAAGSVTRSTDPPSRRGPTPGSRGVDHQLEAGRRRAAGARRAVAAPRPSSACRRRSWAARGCRPGTSRAPRWTHCWMPGRAARSPWSARVRDGARRWRRRRGRPAPRRVGPVAWVSLDPSDNQPRAFWSYVVGALRGTRGGAARQPPGAAGARARQRVARCCAGSSPGWSSCPRRSCWCSTTSTWSTTRRCSRR